MPAFESIDEKIFQIYILLKNKTRTNIYKNILFLGDLKPKLPKLIIHKDEETNKIRLKTTKITDVCKTVHRNVLL
jgi:superfamily I DNA and/or RNA helicase